MLILGIESSCDETAAAVIEAAEGGRLVLRSSIVASQTELHKRFGGVVPEIASRAHTEAIVRIPGAALERARTSGGQLSAIGVTYTPGLIGALLVGVNFAKALAYSAGVPLVGVNHIKAHAAATFIATDAAADPPEQLDPAPLPTPDSPALVLVASGGHTSILLMRSPTQYETLGRTRDDAMGEAFDKIGRVLGLPYPGGAALDRLAAEFFASGREPTLSLPSAAIAGDTLDFSFSGLKPCVLGMVSRLGMALRPPNPSRSRPNPQNPACGRHCITQPANCTTSYGVFLAVLALLCRLRAVIVSPAAKFQRYIQAGFPHTLIPTIVDKCVHIPITIAVSSLF